MTSFSKSSQHDVSRSLDLYDQAGELIPGWTQLISRRADQFAHGASPIYAQRAKGSRFIDVDENEYIDWVSAVGAIILGHADEVVDAAVKEQIDRGSLFSANSPLELELAEELNDTIPSSQMVRYAKGGGDACAIAVRIAPRHNRQRQDPLLWLSWLARLVPGRQLWRRPRKRRISLRRHRADRCPQSLGRHCHPLRLRRFGDAGRVARPTRRRGRRHHDGAGPLRTAPARLSGKR